MSTVKRKVATRATLKYVSSDLLDFDPYNPRFGGLMDNCSQIEVQAALMAEPYYAQELVDSLLKNGFIDYEPLVVKRVGNRFCVVEGNRRLAAIREILSNRDKYEGRIDDLLKIPAIVFPDKPNEELRNEMRVYLGVRHLLGFREWPSLSKAQFLERLSSEDGGLDKVLKELRLSRTQARRFLVPFRLLHKYGFTIPKGEDFWVLGEALGRAGVKNFLQLEVDNMLAIESCNKKRLDVLLDYLYGPRLKVGGRDGTKRIISDTRDISRLARVLDFEKAAAVLADGKGLDEAEIYVDTRDESIKRLQKLSKAAGTLTKKLIASSKTPEAAELSRTQRDFSGAVTRFADKESE